MAARDIAVINSTLVELKLNGQSFREISECLGMPRGTVTSRYYRLRGVRHPSQIKRDEHVKKIRQQERSARNKLRSLAAIQAARELRNGVSFSIAIAKARASGASLEMIGVCCGMSKQAVHKKLRSNAKGKAAGALLQGRSN
jgi:hypothetical protein